MWSASNIMLRAEGAKTFYHGMQQASSTIPFDVLSPARRRGCQICVQKSRSSTMFREVGAGVY